jgi:hypothetical protein
MSLERVLFISVILLLGVMLVFKSCEKEKPNLPAKPPVDIQKYKDVIANMQNNIHVINLYNNRLNSDLANVRLQKDEIEKRYRTELSKLRSVTPEECDTVFVTYDAFIDSLEGVHSLEIKTLESVISNKDSIIHYQENIINSHEQVESGLQAIISQQAKDKKELKRKKNKQIVIGALGGFVAGIITSIFL